MILNITLEDNDMLKFNAKNMNGDVIEIVVAYAEFGDGLEVRSNIDDHHIDSATIDLAEAEL